MDPSVPAKRMVQSKLDEEIEARIVTAPDAVTSYTTPVPDTKLATPYRLPSAPRTGAPTGWP